MITLKLTEQQLQHLYSLALNALGEVMLKPDFKGSNADKLLNILEENIPAKLPEDK